MPASRQMLLVALSLLTLYVIWGSTYFAIRVALDAYPPFQIGTLRFLVAGLVLYGVLRLRGVPSPTPREWRGATLVGGLLVVGGTGLVAVAEQWVATSLAAVLVATMPLWAAMFGGLFGEWPTRFEWLGLLLGFFGVVLLNTESNLRAHPLGAGLLIVSPAAWALGSVLSRRVPLPGGLMAPAAQMLAGSVLLGLLSLLVGEAWTFEVHVRELFAVAYLVVFGSLLGYSAYNFLLRTVRPALATSYAYVNPLVALGLGVGFRDERITPRGLFATGIVVGAVALIALFRSRFPTARASLGSSSGRRP